MDHKVVVKSPQRMVNSINTKIEILKQLDVWETEILTILIVNLKNE